MQSLFLPYLQILSFPDPETEMLKVSHKKSCLICVELRISKYYVMFYSRDLTFSKSGGEIRQRKQQQTLTLNCIFSEGLVDTTAKMWSKIVWIRNKNYLHFTNFKKIFLDRFKAELLLLKLIHLFVREGRYGFFNFGNLVR